MSKVRIGDIVYFWTQNTAQHSNGQGSGPYAAMVTQIFFDSGREGYINLKVFPPFRPPYDEGSVPRLKTDSEKDTQPLPPRWWAVPVEEE